MYTLWENSRKIYTVQYMFSRIFPSIYVYNLYVYNLRRGGGLWLFFVLSFQVVLIRDLYTYGDRGTGVGFGILSLYDIYMWLRNARV